MRRDGQFFIITAVLIAGALLSTTTVLASSQTVNYNTVLERHAGAVLSNAAHEIRSEWWNSSWSWRKTVVLEERSGQFLENESVSVALDAQRSRIADDCSDIRMVYQQETKRWINTTACGIDTYSSETDAVARYTVDAGEGTAVEDVTGHGHDGSFSGSPVWASGRFSAGLAFDPADAVTVPDDDALDFTGGGLTDMLWVRPRSGPTGSYRQLFVKGDGSPSGGRNYGMWLRPNANTVHFRVDPNNQGISATD
ncbi:MAG: hypothetical protein SVW77_02210, partial [Candidatus Nanohaloarchaea archaeon]|nr:hypothetical protein [Candidatus Nanohaloarchaea archaeon]